MMTNKSLAVWSFVLVFVGITAKAKAQHADSIPLSRNRPLVCGYVQDVRNHSLSLRHYGDGVIVKSCSGADSVFSLTAGVVTNVTAFEGGYICVVANGTRTVSYTLLKSTPLAKGTKIEKRAYIGAIELADSHGEVTVVVAKGRKALRFEETIDFLNEK